MVPRGVGVRTAVFAGLMMLCGCTETARNAVAAGEGAPAAPTLSALERSAERIANEMETLRRIEQARTTPAPDPIDERSVPPELLRPTSFSWVGPVDGVLREVAAQIGYAFGATGAAPELAAVVEVHAKDEPLVRVLQEIGLQVRKWGTVFVDPDGRRIELRYDRGPAETAAAIPGPQPLVPAGRR